MEFNGFNFDLGGTIGGSPWDALALKGGNAFINPADVSTMPTGDNLSLINPTMPALPDDLASYKGPKLSWTDRLSSALANPGFQAMLGKMGQELTYRGTPANALGMGVAQMGQSMQLADLLKKLKAQGSSIGDVVGSGPQPSALNNLGFQNSPTIGGGDVVGLTPEQIMAANTSAQDYEIKTAKNAIDLMKEIADVRYKDLLGPAHASYYGKAGEHLAAEAGKTTYLTDKEREAQNKWSSYIESVRSGRVPLPAGIDQSYLGYLGAVSPEYGHKLIDEIAKSKSQGVPLHFAMDDHFVYGLDSRTGRVVSQFPVSKGGSPELKSSMSNAARDLIQGRLLTLIDQHGPKGPADLERLKALRNAMATQQFPGASYPAVRSEFERIGKPELMDAIRNIEAMYLDAINKGHHPLTAERAVDEYLGKIKTSGLENIPVPPSQTPSYSLEMPSAGNTLQSFKPNSQIPAKPGAKSAVKEYKSFAEGIQTMLKDKPAGDYRFEVNGKEMTITWNGIPKGGTIGEWFVKTSK